MKTTELFTAFFVFCLSAYIFWTTVWYAVLTFETANISLFIKVPMFITIIILMFAPFILGLYVYYLEDD